MNFDRNSDQKEKPYLHSKLIACNSEHTYSMPYTHSQENLDHRPGLRAESLSSLEPPSKQSFRATGTQSRMLHKHSDYVNTLETNSLE